MEETCGNSASSDDDSWVPHPAIQSSSMSGMKRSRSFKSPLLTDLVRHCDAIPPRIVFRGSALPHSIWNSWVKEMASDIQLVEAWRSAGIEDAIMASTIDVRLDHPAMEALCFFWCPDTNTFVFPWGEASFTLEDAHVLGNLPVWGSLINRQLTPEENSLCTRLALEMKKIKQHHSDGKSPSKVMLKTWLEWFFELKDDPKLRHAGFLVCWLARNVVPPHPHGEVPWAAFSLAVMLSRGIRIGLAPLATANIYHDLSNIISKGLTSKNNNQRRTVEVWSPFALLQAWVWERFERLRPTQFVVPTNTRISCWDKKKKITPTAEALQIFTDEQFYTWRPYSDNLGRWKQPLWYSMKSQKINTKDCSPSWLHEFAAIILPTKLLGFYGDTLISSEWYQPLRVLRQFGYDQGIPSSFDCETFTLREKAIEHFGSEVVIPSIKRHGNTSDSYIKWWHKQKIKYQKALSVLRAAPIDQAAKENETSIENYSASRSCNENTSNKERLVLENFCIGSGNNSASTSMCAEIHDNSARKRKLEGNDLNKREEEAPVIHENYDYDVLQQDILVNELEDFLHRGLLSEWEPSTHHGKCAKSITALKDTYGNAAMQMYPLFFQLIPQQPHYRGLLDASISEEIRIEVYSSKWYRVVDLMKKALKTTCETQISEIDDLLVEAHKLQGLGFHVKHVIARLREPQARLERLEEAKIRLEKVKCMYEEFENLKEQIAELRSKLTSFEQKIAENKDFISFEQEEDLKKQVVASQEYLRAMEDKVNTLACKGSKVT